MTTPVDQVELSVIEESGVELIVLDAPSAQIAVGPTLSSATPQPLGTAAAGSSASASRANHVHAHGNLAGGSLHALVTAGAAGFMSSTQFSLLDGATSAATVNALVRRDVNGSFAGNVITGSSFVGPLTGNAATAAKLLTARTINGVSFDGTANITITASLANSITFNNSGAGAASGTTFNGTAARTISYNTIGSPSVTGTGASGTWGISVTGNAATATRLATPRAINGVNFDGTAAITVTANTANALTFSDAGSGAASGSTFNGSAGRTISYNSVGAPSISGTNATGTWGISISGVAATATALTTGRTISLTGDVTGTSGTFNGTANLSFATTLANSGVAAGTYRSVSVNAKGIVTAGTNPTTLAGYGITDAATSAHVHGNITNAGAIGTTSGLPIITGASGVLQAGAFGTTSGTFCQGNDSRLSDQRTPTDASVTDAKVATGAAIAFSKLAPLAAGNILLGNASNVPTATAVTGDIAISNAGVVSISAGVIVDADINASAGIAHGKLATISAGQVLLGNASNVPTATALSGDVTINSSGVTSIAAGVIVDADVNASAAIAGTKINPNFGSQDITLSGGDRSVTVSTSHALLFGTNNIERLRIAADGRAIKGATTSIAGVNIGNGALATGWQIHGTDLAGASSSSMSWADNAFSTYFNSGKSRGGVVGAHGIVLDGDQLGYYHWIASDGTQFRSAAYMGALVSGAPTAGSVPARIIWGTTAVGAATPTQRMEITSGGTVRVAAVLSAGAVTTQSVVPTNSNVTATATASSLLNGIRTGTPTGNIDLQLPTGTNMEAAFADLQNNQAFEWSVVNLAAATHIITVTANTDHTVVGNMAVAAATSGRFMTRKTTTNTFITYRIS